MRLARGQGFEGRQEAVLDKHDYHQHLPAPHASQAWPSTPSSSPLQEMATVPTSQIRKPRGRKPKSKLSRAEPPHKPRVTAAQARACAPPPVPAAPALPRELTCPPATWPSLHLDYSKKDNSHSPKGGHTSQPRTCTGGSCHAEESTTTGNTMWGAASQQDARTATAHRCTGLG